MSSLLKDALAQEERIQRYGIVINKMPSGGYKFTFPIVFPEAEEREGFLTSLRQELRGAEFKHYIGYMTVIKEGLLRKSEVLMSFGEQGTYVSFRGEENSERALRLVDRIITSEALGLGEHWKKQGFDKAEIKRRFSEIAAILRSG